jgi:2-keto-4-pentenoate hydratase/2-oxohepta-3-ene-1,7-dioic acid hydratase in catechol pathway
MGATKNSSGFALATLRASHGLRAAVQVDKQYYILADIPQYQPFEARTTVFELLSDWTSNFRKLNDIVDDIRSGNGAFEAALVSAGEVLLETPVRFPRKLICIGANYGGHLREMGFPAEKMTPMPYFMRPPTTSLVGPGRTVRKPRMTKQFDWEIELVVVLGAPLRHAKTVDEAANAIVGYTVGVDLSCRDLQMAKDIGMDIGRGKAQDTLAPCGPVIVPKQFLRGGVGDLALKLWVNGEQMVDGSTSDMLYSPEEQVLELSRFTTLEAGDLVFTGAPAGSAKANGERWLQVGDQIRAEIEQVGVLEVVVCEDV